MRESLRVFRTQPAFAAAVVLVLALCTAANSALFTVVNALMLRPRPFPHSEQLVEISVPNARGRLEDLLRARSIASVGAFTPWNYAVTTADGVRMAYTQRVTADLIPLLQIRPALGRTLTHSDFGTKVAMLGYDYWKSLGARPDIAGQSIILNSESYSIVGVLPADYFLDVRDAKLIVPDLRTPGRTIARLHPGATPAQAQAEIAALAPGSRPQVTSLSRAFFSNDFIPFLLLLVTAACVLLITCANLANLQLVRGMARRREFAIRTAIGASHTSLLLQLLRESAILATVATALGLLLTRVLHDAILATLPAHITRRLSGADALTLDGRVVAFTIGVGAITVLLFGLLPAMSALRFDVMTRLRDAARGSTRERQRFGQMLVTVEIALAVMLLAGAALTFKNLIQLQNQYLGFHPQGVLRAMFDLSPARFAAPVQKVKGLNEVEQRLGNLPGVTSVGMASQAFPFGGPRVRGSRFEIFGKPDLEARAQVFNVNSAFLDSVRVPLLRGRWFTAADTLSSAPVVVLSEDVAQRYWGAAECLGSRVRLEPESPGSVWATVVGVVGDVKNPLAEFWSPLAYRPYAQNPSIGGVTLMIRASVADPLSIAATVRRELHAIDPAAPEIRIVANLDNAVRDYISPERFTTTLLAIFAAIGLALAAAGVYAVMRYWVASRTGEIGIRMALGAQQSNVLRLVLGRATIAAAYGVAAGLAGAIAFRKVIATQLMGVNPADPLALGAAAAVLFAVSLLAAWTPARRAVQIEPAEALRAE